MKKKKYAFFVTFSLALLSCVDNQTPIDKTKLLGNDYRLFQDSPVWTLAKAVKSENVEEMRRIIKQEKIDVNYQESKFGNTLLMLTVLNQQYAFCKVLLELGADPNKHNTYNGTSAIIEAAGIDEQSNDFLTLLLANNANPNDEETGKRQEGNSTRSTPLIKACGLNTGDKSSLEKVKILVNAGADINFKNEFGQSPIKEAITFDHFDVVLYLLQKGYDFKQVINVANGKNYYLWDELRFSLLPIGSKEYNQKMEVIDFLKQRGIDYRKVAIPDYAIQQAKKLYPKKWQTYLEKY